MECSLCMEALASSVCAAPCGHVYHTACLQSVLSSSDANESVIPVSGCPVCRHPCALQDVRLLHWQQAQAPGGNPRSGTTENAAKNMRVHVSVEVDREERIHALEVENQRLQQQSVQWEAKAAKWKEHYESTLQLLNEMLELSEQADAPPSPPSSTFSTSLVHDNKQEALTTSVVVLNDSAVSQAGAMPTARTQSMPTMPVSFISNTTNPFLGDTKRIFSTTGPITVQFADTIPVVPSLQYGECLQLTNNELSASVTSHPFLGLSQINTTSIASSGPNRTIVTPPSLATLTSSSQSGFPPSVQQDTPSPQWPLWIPSRSVDEASPQRSEDAKQQAESASKAVSMPSDKMQPAPSQPTEMGAASPTVATTWDQLDQSIPPPIEAPVRPTLFASQDAELTAITDLNDSMITRRHTIASVSFKPQAANKPTTPTAPTTASPSLIQQQLHAAMTEAAYEQEQLDKHGFVMLDKDPRLTQQPKPIAKKSEDTGMKFSTIKRLWTISFEEAEFERRKQSLAQARVIEKPTLLCCYASDSDNDTSDDSDENQVETSSDTDHLCQDSEGE